MHLFIHGNRKIDKKIYNRFQIDDIQAHIQN